MDNAPDKALLREGSVHARPSSEDCSSFLTFDARLIDVETERTAGKELARREEKFANFPLRGVPTVMW